MREPSLISVQARVVKETLVGSLADAVAARLSLPLEAPVEAALSARPDGPLRLLARAGFHARAIQLERFEPARAPVTWLGAELRGRRTEGVGWSEAASVVASELARDEPADRPDPGDERAVTWKIPGPGGHVRHFVAERAHADYALGESPGDAKRAWVLGFLVHCCVEAAPPS